MWVIFLWCFRRVVYIYECDFMFRKLRQFVFCRDVGYQMNFVNGCQIIVQYWGIGERWYCYVSLGNVKFMVYDYIFVFFDRYNLCKFKWLKEFIK